MRAKGQGRPATTLAMREENEAIIKGSTKTKLARTEMASSTGSAERWSIPGEKKGKSRC